MLRFDDITLDFADQRILNKASFTIEAGERVCLIGRNGAGKTTIFRILSGTVQPDSGDVHYLPDLRISQLEQALPETTTDTVYDYVAQGLAGLQKLIDEYQALSHSNPDKTGMRRLEKLQNQIESAGGWHIDTQVQSLLSELDIPAHKKISQLSGGWQRRAALARALVNQPDLLLLDEPTNHLDLSAIEWLEDRIYGFAGSVLFVTHDRAFLQRLATRILELDRGKLTSWPGDYRRFLIHKDKALQEEQRSNKEFDKRLEQEEAWIRQGIKARRTRNEGRVRALKAMRDEFSRRTRPEAGARIYVEDAELSGRKVIEARNISHAYNDEVLFQGLTLRIKRGDRIGLIGNNGVGKSTLLKILLGRLQPTSGSVKLGTNLVTGYFDQTRESLDPEKTVAEVVGEDSDYVRINGRQRHVIGYLKGFLFTPRRAMTRVSALSGGECNRVILAKLLTKPTNLLVMDEPTNDLDVETLEVLEEKLCEYQGTLIVVSHDREFIDHVVTSTLVFEDDGRVQAYAGGYSDWLRRGKHLLETDDPHDGAGSLGQQVEKPGRQSSKLSYKLKRELDLLPDRIHELEEAIEVLQQQTQSPDFYAQGHDTYQPVLKDLAAREQELDLAMQRWTELEQLMSEMSTKKK